MTTGEALTAMARAQEACDQAIRERDEARSAVAERNEQMDRALDRIEGLRRERDEALALLKKSDEQGTKAVAGWEQATRERDEALALLRAAQAEREAVASQHEAECDRLERDRDEATARLASVNATLAETARALARVIQGRDEANGLAAKAIRGMFAAELLPSGHAWAVDWYELYEAAAANGWLTAEDLSKSRAAAMIGDYG